jgi:hypothetical protein
MQAENEKRTIGGAFGAHVHHYAIAVLCVVLTVMAIVDVRPLLRNAAIGTAAANLATATGNLAKLVGTDCTGSKDPICTVSGLHATIATINDPRAGLPRTLRNVNTLTAQMARTSNTGRLFAVDEHAMLTGGKDSQGRVHPGIMQGFQALVTTAGDQLTGKDGTIPRLNADLGALHDTLGGVTSLIGTDCQGEQAGCSPFGIRGMVAAGTKTIDTTNAFIAHPDWATMRSNFAAASGNFDRTLIGVNSFLGDDCLVPGTAVRSLRANCTPYGLRGTGDLGYQYFYAWGHPAKMGFLKTLGLRVLLPIGLKAVPGVAEALASHAFPLTVKEVK